MDIEKKPYECREANCSMSFVNKDHLDVHIRKHELHLTLTPTTPCKTLFVDETPTPTTFLKELESEMFQELNTDNPFDVTFRKANFNSGGAHNFVIPDSSSLIACLPDSEVLNTPSITLPSEPETPIILKSHFSRKQTRSVPDTQTTESTDTLPFTPEGNASLEEVSHQNITEYELSVENSHFKTVSHAGTVYSVEQEQQSIIQRTCAPRSNVVQTPVITSIGNSSILKPITTGVPTAVVVTRPSANVVRNLTPTPVAVVTEKPSQVKSEQPQAIVQSVCVTPMVQLMIRLPDGQTMPVQFPVMTSAPAPAATAPSSIIQSVQTLEQPTSMPNSVAKMKLKEVLSMNQKSSGINKTAQPTVKPKPKPHIQPLPHEDLLAEFGISPPSSPISSQKSNHTGRKRREASDNPDEKRKRSLERNRAAATRCREKRKLWITALEKKADELANTNTQLQHEVSQLRNEVAQLKTMLLAHKDCPVTLQQKGMAYDAEKDYTTVHIINSRPEDLQRVPNSSMVSPLASEFMEVEISSVQSISDASLTSDTSEASFKER